jgi:hypothetical protein
VDVVDDLCMSGSVITCPYTADHYLVFLCHLAGVVSPCFLLFTIYHFGVGLFPFSLLLFFVLLGHPVS